MTLFKYSMKKAIKYILILLSIVIMLLVGNSNMIVAHAQKVNEYSDVFDDLRQDPNFKAEDYPSMTLDYWKTQTNQPMIEVISIAESSDDELYIYTYQPLNYDLELTATAISMSLGFSADGQDLQPKIYDLYLASSYGVYNKYVVEKLDVSDEPYRYYNIVTIYRSYNSTIDWHAPPVGAEATGSEYGIGVGQQWCAYYQNDTIVYEMGTFETLEINIDFVGNFDFGSGLQWGNIGGLYNECDMWFLSFSCDQYVIRHIYDADLSYRQRSVEKVSIAYSDYEYTYGEWSENIPVTLKDTDKAQYKGEGLLAKEYTWDSISSVDNFLKRADELDVTITKECKQALENSQWVFIFTQTESKEIINGGTFIFEYMDIEKVTVLRLHFIDIHGDVYNLGVVSDRVNPDNESDGHGSGIDLTQISDWFEKILMLIGILILVVILGYLSPIFSVVFKVLVTCIKWAFKGMLTIISAPFKLIGAMFKSNKRK